MNQQKILFIDRDGTLIVEPDDKQVDSIDKLQLLPGVIPALLSLKQADYKFVMVTNQDGLGTKSFPQEDFDRPHQFMLDIFSSQGITFDKIYICPHFEDQKCDCRKPKVGLILDYLSSQVIDRTDSYVIGDRQTDILLAANMGIPGIHFGSEGASSWEQVQKSILFKNKISTYRRKTNETDINIVIDLNTPMLLEIDTGIAFFDHMLEQFAKHGGFGLIATVKGDIEIDDHHTVEDTAIALGHALQQALGNKKGIGRYGFVLPMDEALAQVAIDICGRATFLFKGTFGREKVGMLSTECVPHFFQSLAHSLGAALHISVSGDNAHHMVEAVFKAVGRSIRQAIQKVDNVLPSTKGIL